MAGLVSTPKATVARGSNRAAPAAVWETTAVAKKAPVQVAVAATIAGLVAVVLAVKATCKPMEMVLTEVPATTLLSPEKVCAMVLVAAVLLTAAQRAKADAPTLVLVAGAAANPLLKPGLAAEGAALTQIVLRTAPTTGKQQTMAAVAA